MICKKHGLTVTPNNPCPVCESEDEQGNFANHTCGECAWAYVWAGKQENFTCRRTGWMNSETGDGHSVSMSACPAFVAKTLENNDVKL